MENNNLRSPVSVPQPPIIPNAPAEESNKLIIWLVIGLVVIMAVVGGMYLVLNRQQTTSKPTAVSKTIAPAAEENLESDLNAIDVSSGENDFTSVDQDLKQL